VRTSKSACAPRTGDPTPSTPCYYLAALLPCALPSTRVPYLTNVSTVCAQWVAGGH
jgi:hypothetical protein